MRIAHSCHPVQWYHRTTSTLAQQALRMRRAAPQSSCTCAICSLCANNVMSCELLEFADSKFLYQALWKTNDILKTTHQPQRKLLPYMDWTFMNGHGKFHVRRVPARVQSEKNKLPVYRESDFKTASYLMFYAVKFHLSFVNIKFIDNLDRLESFTS